MADNTMTRDSSTKVWSLTDDLSTLTATKKTDKITLNTKDQYLDGNIEITVAPADAALAASATGSATISLVTVGDKSNNAYPLTGSADITGTASASTTTSGYAVKDSTTGTGSTSGTALLNATISAASATVTASGTAASPSVAIDTSNDNISVGTITTTKPTSGYYAAVKATAEATTVTDSAPTTAFGTKGYLGATSGEITKVTTTVNAKTGVDYYVPITAGSITASSYNSTSQTGNDLSGYTEQTVTVPSKGSLVLSEGYYPKTFVTLDAMLDGKTDTAGTAAGDIKSGFIAYDVDGQKLSGTLSQLTSSNFSGGLSTLGGGTLTLADDNPVYDSTNNTYTWNYSGSASDSITITSPTDKEGWLAKNTTIYTNTISSGDFTSSLTLDKAVLAHDSTATETKVAVSASGTATGVATASSGSYYVTINCSQTAAGNITHGASIKKGYVPEDVSSKVDIATSANITGNGTKVYLATTTISDAMTSITASSGYTAPTLVTTAPTAPYLDILSTATTTANKVVTNSSATSHAYIPIFTGSYSIA